MNALAEIKSRFSKALSQITDDIDPLLAMIRPAQDSRFGDYQANCAMPLKAKLNRSSPEIAGQILDLVSIDDFCSKSEIAGPGFINLTLSDAWLIEQLNEALVDPRLGIPATKSVKTFVIDFSSPNVAKPMHVGHIRSTVIGNALARIIRFAGHTVITDNHLGDWGTQFGMIIYGFKHFVDQQAYQDQPITELSRIYRLVRQLIDYHDGKKNVTGIRENIGKMETGLAELESSESTGDKAADKKTRKELGRLKARIADEKDSLLSLQAMITAVENDDSLMELAQSHVGISRAVLEETAKLHEGDTENIRLWKEFLPFCHEDIQRIYDRLEITFDHELGESFYHDQLASVVESLEEKNLARQSDGATCVFLENYDAPMIIRKKDGAFLYSTTDLATIKYRVEKWNPDIVLYVVDHRQQDHFSKLFDAARLWGFSDTKLIHVSFGTVLGEDGKPFKTRSGDTVGLEGLLDEAVARALKVVTTENPDLPNDQKDEISRVVGIGALKYADLSQNRSSDYKFSYDKMLALTGNTATYLQYSYARVQGIFAKGEVDVDSLRSDPAPIILDHEIERKLAVNLLRFSEAIDEVMVDYKPNLLANYLFELTQHFFTFYAACPVLKADNDSLKKSRLQLCDLTARTIKTGLDLLGISVVDKM